MTLLYVINWYILQWFWMRIYREIDLTTSKTKAYGVIGFIVPLTGWKTDYIYKYKWRKTLWKTNYKRTARK